MDLLKYSDRSDGLNPNELIFLLPDLPDPEAIVELKNQIDIINSRLSNDSQTLETLNYGSLTAGVLSVLAAIGTGGFGAGVLACASAIGATSTFWYSDRIRGDNDRTLEFTIKLSSILDRANPQRVAGLWSLSGSKERFWRFLCKAAIDGYEDGEDIRIRTQVDGVWYGLAPTQALCERFATEFGLSASDLLDRLEAIEQNRRQWVAPVNSLPFPDRLPSRPSALDAPIPGEDIVSPGTPTMPSLPPSWPLKSRSETEPPSVDLVDTIAQNMFSYAIIGAPGSGKGYLGSHVWRRVQADGLKVFALEPKNDPKERGYWETCDFVYSGICEDLADDLGISSDPQAQFGDFDAATKSAWLFHAIATYRKWVREIGRAPHILVFDEATVLLGHAKECDKKLFAEIRGLLSHLTSSGNSQQHYIFLLGHIANLATYGLSGGEMACLKNLYLYSVTQTDIKNLLSAGKTTYFGERFGTEILPKLRKLARQSDCDRVFYFGQTNQWYPMKRLPNLCGYDRDSGTFVNSQNRRNKTLSKSSPQLGEGDVATAMSSPSLKLTENHRKVLRRAKFFYEEDIAFFISEQRRSFRDSNTGEHLSAQEVKRICSELAHMGYGIVSMDEFIPDEGKFLEVKENGEIES